VIYLDTNIYIYAFCNNVDDQNQKVISQKILREAVKEKKFDVYHVCFSNYYNCHELVTFDKGFNRFRDFSMTDIRVL